MMQLLHHKNFIRLTSLTPSCHLSFAKDGSNTSVTLEVAYLLVFVKEIFCWFSRNRYFLHTRNSDVIYNQN